MKPKSPKNPTAPDPEPPPGPSPIRNLVFRGDREPREWKSPVAPPWRTFSKESRESQGRDHILEPAEIQAINAAIYLRRPLLVTGPPGTGKSSLAEAIRWELQLDEVLKWAITSRTVLKDGLYQYDAVGRLHQFMLQGRDKDHDDPREAPDIREFLTLGPLGTALADSTAERPRILLIDEIDKGDVDLPNDLLHVFEDGYFKIPELERLPKKPEFEKLDISMADGGVFPVPRGKVQCAAFPIVLLTSNGERDFPPAFLRRCLRLKLDAPKPKQLVRIVATRFGRTVEEVQEEFGKLIEEFVVERDQKGRQLATDQFLNALHLVKHAGVEASFAQLRAVVLQALNDPQA